MLDVTPLRRHPAFRRLWFGQGISFIGTEIAEVALAYQMYQLTGSTLAVGLISLTHLVPLLTLTVIGGAIADAFDRRRVMLVQQVGMVAGSLGLAANAALSHPRVWPLYVFQFVISAAFSIICARRTCAGSAAFNSVSRSVRVRGASCRGVRRNAVRIGPATGVMIAEITRSTSGRYLSCWR